LTVNGKGNIYTVDPAALQKDFWAVFHGSQEMNLLKEGASKLVFFPKEMLRFLDKQARKEGCTVTKVIRDSVMLYMQNNQAVPKKEIPLPRKYKRRDGSSAVKEGSAD
jgi:hypothetical protein